MGGAFSKHKVCHDCKTEKSDCKTCYYCDRLKCIENHISKVEIEGKNRWTCVTCQIAQENRVSKKSGFLSTNLESGDGTLKSMKKTLTLKLDQYKGGIDGLEALWKELTGESISSQISQDKPNFYKVLDI